MVRVLILIFLFVCNSLFSQNFQGVVTYNTNRKLDLQMSDSKMNTDMQKQIQEMLQKQFQREYTLSFTNSESIYKEAQSLETPKSSGGMTIIMAGSATTDVLYKNNKEKRYASKRDMMGKLFLIKDNLEKLDWKLENETKMIGAYQCYKATVKLMGQRSSSIRVGIDYNEQEETDTQVEEREIIITAWYAPEIPVSNGPKHYWGLPGLILEVSDGNETILCSKIVINPKKKIEIKEPVKGKIVTNKEFENVIEKKLREMADHMSRRSNGNEIKIRIGG